MLRDLHDGDCPRSEDENVLHVGVNSQASGHDIEHGVAEDAAGRHHQKRVAQDRLVLAVEAHLLHPGKQPFETALQH